MAHLTTPNGTAFEVSGPKGAPMVALIHGLGLSRHLWADHIAALSHDFRVLTYDLYGHGDSKPPGETASLTVYSEQLLGLLDHLKVARAHVVGFSIGGMINRRFALDHGDRLNGLVILNSPHDRGTEGQSQVEARAATVRDQGAMATMDSALKRWFTSEYLRTGSGPKKVQDWRILVDPESYAQAAWVLANGVRELIRPDPAVTARTLVMTCQNDTGSTPAMSAEIVAEIAAATLHIIPNLQHLGLMENPDAFTKPILKFLKDQ